MLELEKKSVIRKFAFWIVTTLMVSLGFIVWTHWHTLEALHEKPSAMEPLYQKQKVISGLQVHLEKYRRLSTNFRKASNEEIDQAKAELKTAFSRGLQALNQKSPSPEELNLEKQIGTKVTELFGLIAQVEPTFFSRDAYHDPGVLSLHEDVTKSLRELDRLLESKLGLVGSGSTDTETRSLIFLLVAGGVILALMLASLLRTYFAYTRPLNRLRDYASLMGEGKPLPSTLPDFSGPFGEIQRVIDQLSQGVETYKRDRHKFLLDVVADLRVPLGMLQEGKHLVGSPQPNDLRVDTTPVQFQAAESVRRGMAIMSGSLDDLTDIVDINRLESRLEEKTVDLSDLVSDASRMIGGGEYGKKISILAPPIPVWASVDVRRMERVLILILSKILDTLTSPTTGVSIQVSLANQSSFRGIEILIREVDKQRGTRLAAAGGPDQDILKHWMSETGLGMLLAQKIIKAHGGSLTAAGVAGGSISVTIRLPQERVISHGLISPPVEGTRIGLTGAIPESLNQAASLPGSSPQAKA